MSGTAPAPLPLMDRVRHSLRLRQYAPRTQETYLTWIRRYTTFHRHCRLLDLGPAHLSAFLAHLVAARRVSSSTQSQAFSAISFFHREVLGTSIGAVPPLVRSPGPRRVPVAFTRAEVDAVLLELRGAPQLVAGLTYGAGLRVREALGLRVKDVDLESRLITVRQQKSRKERIVPVPVLLQSRLAAHLESVCRQHRLDLASGLGRVPLPDGLDRKLPNAGREWGWQFVFPAARVSFDSRFGTPCREHLHESVVQRAVVTAVRRAGIPKRASCHTFRHSCAAHLLEDGHDVRTVQELLGHADITTTLLYRNVLRQQAASASEPDGEREGA